MQVVTVLLDGTMPRALHLLRADHGSNLQTLARGRALDASLQHGGKKKTGHGSIAVSRAKAAKLKDADFNDAARQLRPSPITLCPE